MGPLPQTQLERLLLSHARRYGADGRFGAQMIDLEQDQDKAACHGEGQRHRGATDHPRRPCAGSRRSAQHRT
ncbi:hypothetical protein [Streptomyces cellulosae]|uniref:hypothetical protein n=1 Tax=Streptomyces cellulosae TaxID=1968 RepID=UPI00387E6086